MYVDLRRPCHLVAAIVLLAALLRLPTAFFELFHHPDEVWQYLEPAYGTVTGRSVVTWEYRAGMRSWLIPTVLAAPMWLGKATSPDGQFYLILPRLLLVGGSLAIVGFGTAIAARVSRLHAIVVGLVLATAFELVYFSARALSDTIAVALFIPAAWALLPPGRDTRRLLIGGLLLGLCVSVRFQLAPALALFVILCCRLDWRMWLWVLIGGAGGLAIDGAIDVAHGAPPLGWMIENVRQNLIANRSVDYGTEPAWWYLANQLRVWGWTSLFVLALASRGARWQPILLAVALANIAVHSLIPHKEYRFVWLSSVLLLLLAGLGTADVIAWCARCWPRRRLVAGIAIVFWLGASIATATSKGGREQWTGGGRALALMRAEHREPDACGLAYLHPDRDQRVAFTYVDRAIPIYFLDRPSAAADVRSYSPAFNMIVAPPAERFLFDPAYALQMCKYKRRSADGPQQVCLYVRPGACVGTLPPGNDVNAAMVRQRR